MAAASDDRVDSRVPVDVADFRQRWERLWDQGVAPGTRWDRSDASPALRDVLSSGKLGPMDGKRALVPGCGRGYDLVAFATAGVAAVGLEISPSAAREAEAYLQSTLNASSQALPMPQMVCDSFFTWRDPQGGFDLGWDYTFGCAMHPQERGTWAEGWAKALKPGATLITLLYPVDPSADPHIGPPFPVSMDLYKDLLQAHFKLQSSEPVPNQLSHAGREGKEHIAFWTKL